MPRGRPKSNKNPITKTKKNKIKWVTAIEVDGRKVCPECESQRNIELLKYDLEDKNGTTYFIGDYHCIPCDVMMKIEMPFNSL